MSAQTFICPSSGRLCERFNDANSSRAATERLLKEVDQIRGGKIFRVVPGLLGIANQLDELTEAAESEFERYDHMLDVDSLDCSGGCQIEGQPIFTVVSSHSHPETISDGAILTVFGNLAKMSFQKKRGTIIIRS